MTAKEPPRTASSSVCWVRSSSDASSRRGCDADAEAAASTAGKRASRSGSSTLSSAAWWPCRCRPAFGTWPERLSEPTGHSASSCVPADHAHNNKKRTFNSNSSTPPPPTGPTVPDATWIILRVLSLDVVFPICFFAFLLFFVLCLFLALFARLLTLRKLIGFLQ